MRVQGVRCTMATSPWKATEGVFSGASWPCPSRSASVGGGDGATAMELSAPLMRSVRDALRTWFRIQGSGFRVQG